MQLIPLILRAFQAIFAIIVLGLSIDLARGQETRIESVPAATGYAAFCGGFGVLVALIGITSLFVSSLEGIITWALDGLSALTMLAAGIAYAVILRNASCNDYWTTWDNPILSGGCADFGEGRVCNSDEGESKSRCTSAKADSAFMFISCVTCLGIVGWSFVKGGRGGWPKM
ncbi:marvel domain-containing protein [Aspergillus cavernicola]|uniref:Marvel domain-containing protein n=1 Tax=Aspergillus cavernicola TaxID=176166 RepID=A0ABR4IDL8_9EURO